MHHGTLHVRCRTFKRHVNLIEHRATSLVNVRVYFWCYCCMINDFVIESLHTATIDRGSLQKKKKKKTIQTNNKKKKGGEKFIVSTKECATSSDLVQPSSNINTYLLLVNGGWCIFVQHLKQTSCSRVVYIQWFERWFASRHEEN